MNTPLIVLLVINYWYSIHFTYFYCSYTKNGMKYLGTSTKSLIESAVSLTSTKDLQEILVIENITYPLNSKPKLHNIERTPRCLGSSMITTNMQIFRLEQKNGVCRANFDFRAQIIVLLRHIYPFRGSKSELAVEKSTTPVLVWLKREIMTMMNIMYG